MATTTSSTTAFTGQSSFSSDLQQVITRAVGIATLPVTLLQNQQTVLTNQQSALTSLSTKFQSLQSAIDNLNTSVGAASYSADMDTSGIVSTSLSTGATAGTYGIKVINLGSHTNAMSSSTLPTVSDPKTGNISTASAFTLTVDGKDYQLTDSQASLAGLASAINASGADVQATVVNIGSTSSPSYLLSVQSNKYANTTISLSDGTNSLLDTLTSGSPVQYQINGQPSTPINSDSRTVTVSPGFSITMRQVGSTNVTVNQTSSGISTALNAFVSAYNSAVDELGNSRGQKNGPLSGESIIYSLTDSLRTLSGYTQTTGTVKNISDLGLSFDQDGHLNLDSSVLSNAANNSFSDVLNFLGTETSGGFLQSASGLLKSLDDSSTGLIAGNKTQITNQLSSLATKIQDDQDRVTALQTSLTAQMASSDALISSLEQQATYFTNLFTTMRQNKSNNG